MDLKSMTFAPDPNFDNDSMPKTVTVTMTIEEALWVTIVSGQQCGDSPHHGIWGCLFGDVFNRYWDDGVIEARKYMSFETPPVTYEDIKEGEE